jgi:plasmid stabilization system protein ParE
VARVVYSEQAQRDLDRIFDFLAQTDPKLARETILLIKEAVVVLERHPFIGRPCEENLRELLVSRGRKGYAALYRYLEGDEVALVLGIRHQREAGYQQS